jgi:dTDP-4-dehydrorhamnose 3,5-epimerase
MPLMLLYNVATKARQDLFLDPREPTPRNRAVTRMSIAPDVGAADLPRILAPRRYADSRGWFSETFHEQRLRELGIVCRFVQDNQSYSSRAGTLRGFHFQVPPMAQAKLVSVARGRILDVAVDLRRGSPTLGKHVAAELSGKSGHQMYVPVGFAHGFLTLEDDTLVFYKASAFYSAAHEQGLRWNDPDIAFAWPTDPAVMTISEKDRALPLLKEFVSPFGYDGHALSALTVPQI